MAHSALLFALFLVAAAEGLAQTGTITCPDGYTILGSACYFISEDTHSGASAEHFCQGYGGHAAVVETRQEMDALRDYLLDRTVHLGVTARASREKLFECSLKLDDHLGFTNFRIGEPNNYGGEDCVIAESGFDFAWEDVQCTETHHVLCKAEATVTKAPCPDGAFLFQDSACFWLDTNRTYTWTAAAAACADRGMHIASVHSQMENHFILGLSYSTRVWIGINDLASESNFVWSDGTAVDYTNWYSTEPSGGDAQNCGYMYYGWDGEWNDAPCSNAYGVVCRGVPEN